MENVKFNYLYRDAGNYKNWGEIVFSNPDRRSINAMTKALADAFLQDGIFVAHQIRVPEIFLFDTGDATSDDHCFHEFDAVESTLEHPTDRHRRSISEFVAEVESQAKRGWVPFAPDEVRAV
ncbi:MAG: hypothetical protein ABSH13_13355 [Candidatus Acidiferrum sp.]